MSKPNIIRAVTVAQSSGFYDWVKEPFESMGYEAVSLSSPGPELQRLADEGWTVETVEMARHISLFKDIKSLLNIIAVIRRLKPTMVHSMTPKAGLLCMMAAWLCRVPVRVHTFTGLVFPTATGVKRRILMATDWFTCACATHVIPEGEGVKADLLNNGITRKPIRVLGHGNINGVNLQRFDPNNPEVLSDASEIRKTDVFSFIFIGRLVGDKGINELVAAFHRLHEEVSATRLILVGRAEPELDPLNAETLIDIDNNPAIEAVGQQQDVRPWLAASDALVFPSYREGFPNVVLEAGAMGLPSIVTDINGSREIIENGRNGLIIPPKNIDALYEAMKQVIISPEHTIQMAQEARPLIASRFEQSYVRNCLFEFYEEILKLK